MDDQAIENCIPPFPTPYLQTMSVPREELADFLTNWDDDVDLYREPDNTDMDSSWQFLSASQLPDFILSDDVVDGELLETAKAEVLSVCSNAREILKVTSNSQISLSDCSNYFLESLVLFLIEGVKDGLPSTRRGTAGMCIEPP